MTEQTTYSIFKEQTQEDVNRIAQKVFANGKLIHVHHNGYATNNPELLARAIGKDNECKDTVFVKDGNVCYEVESDILPVKFFVHACGTTVTEVIEVVAI